MNVCMFLHVWFLMKPLSTILTRIMSGVRMYQEMSWQGWTSFKCFSTLFAGENSFTVVYSSENKNNFLSMYISKYFLIMLFELVWYKIILFHSIKELFHFYVIFYDSCIHSWNGNVLFYHKNRNKTSFLYFSTIKSIGCILVHSFNHKTRVVQKSTFLVKQ